MKLWRVKHFYNIFVLLFTIAITPKSEDKYVVKVFNWSEFHLFEMTLLQNPYFSLKFKLDQQSRQQAVRAYCPNIYILCPYYKTIVFRWHQHFHFLDLLFFPPPTPSNCTNKIVMPDENPAILQKQHKVQYKHHALFFLLLHSKQDNLVLYSKQC